LGAVVAMEGNIAGEVSRACDNFVRKTCRAGTATQSSLLLRKESWEGGALLVRWIA